MEWQSRTKLLIGEQKVEALKNKHVLIVGLGGVGAYVAEILCRSGIGEISIVDHDTISESNINRQLIALNSTVGKSKGVILKKRLLDINPILKIHLFEEYFSEENANKILKHNTYDYVCDCIDTLTPKIMLIKYSIENNYRLISSLGSGGKIDISKVHISDISKSYNCKLGAILRKRLHRINIYSGFKVVFSSEMVKKESIIITKGEKNKKSNLGTISYMPPLFGIYIASEVINDIV